MDIDYFSQHISTCKQNPATLLRWLAGQGSAHLIEASRLQLDLLNKERARQVSPEHLSELAASCLIRAIDMLYSTDSKLHGKQKIDPDLERKVNQIRLTGIKYKPPKRSRKKQKLVVHFGALIKQLREEGLSWQDVARYLHKYHRYKVSVGYIQRLFSEIKKGTGKNDA